MKKMKLLLIVGLMAAMAGCGKKDNNTSESVTVPTTQEVTQTETKETESETEVMTTEESEAQTEAGNGKEITLGEAADGVYTNDYFGLTFEYPQDWTVLSEEERIAMLRAGAGTMIDDEGLIDLTVQAALPLFTASQSTLGTTSNTNINVTAEKQTSMMTALCPEPADYLNLVQEQLSTVTDMEGTTIEYSFGEVEEITLGGKDAAMLPISSVLGGVYNMYQVYFCVYTDDYIVSFVGTYFDDSDEALSEIIDSIQFN